MEIDEAGGWTSRLRSVSRLQWNPIYSMVVAALHFDATVQHVIA